MTINESEKYEKVYAAIDKLDKILANYEDKAYSIRYKEDFTDFYSDLCRLVEDTWFSAWDAHIRHEAEIEK